MRAGRVERCWAELHTEELANAQMTLRETPVRTRDVRLQHALLFPEFDPGGGVRQRIGEKGREDPVYAPIVVDERQQAPVRGTRGERRADLPEVRVQKRTGLRAVALGEPELRCSCFLCSR